MYFSLPRIWSLFYKIQPGHALHDHFLILENDVWTLKLLSPLRIYLARPSTTTLPPADETWKDT
jgi:hypothetical protein